VLLCNNPRATFAGQGRAALQQSSCNFCWKGVLRFSYEMNFLLAIILVFYSVLAAPTPGLNLNLVRSNAQKLEHYDLILLKLKQELQFFNLGITPLGKLQQKIIAKAVKRNKLRPANYNPPRIPEFDRLYEEALDLLASLPEGRYRKALGLNLYLLLRIGRHRIAEAREHMRLMRNTFAQITPELLASGRVLDEHLPGYFRPRSRASIPANRLPVVHEPVDITKALESLSGASPGHALPVRIKPEILDYSEIFKLATEIVTTIPQSSEYSEYLKKMLDKLRAIDSSDLKEARSQLDMIWYMVRTLVLEEN
jgi:hypothetical protein